MANPDNTFSLLLYNKNGRQLASLKSNADTTYNSFNRVAVHGGYDFYVDDMKVVRPKDYNPGAVWAGTGGRNYALVYHLDDPGTTVTDSTGSHHGTKTGGHFRRYRSAGGRALISAAATSG